MGADSPLTADSLTVAAIQLFRQAPEYLSVLLADALQIQYFEPGERVFARDQRARRVCFVLSGAVRVSRRTGSDREIFLIDRRAGELVGLFEGDLADNPNLRVIAAAPSYVGFIRCSDLRRILESDSQFMSRLRSRAVRLIRCLPARLVGLTARNAKHRFQPELLQPFARDSDTPAVSVAPPFPPRRTESSRAVSTHREAVSQELLRLERAGVVQRADGLLASLQPNRVRDDTQHAG